jgi:hypothetical protein
MMLQPGSTLELNSRRQRGNQVMVVVGRAATGAGLLLVSILLLNWAGALPHIATTTFLASPVAFISIAVAAPVSLWAGIALLSDSRSWAHGRGGRVNHVIFVAGIVGAIFGTAWLVLTALALLFYPG